MPEIRWSLQAASDLESIQAYIGRDSPQYAALTIERLIATVERAGDFPLSGRVVPEYGDQLVREILWRSYRIVYRVRGTSVDIVTVFHGSMMLFPGPEQAG